VQKVVRDDNPLKKIFCKKYLLNHVFN